MTTNTTAPKKWGNTPQALVVAGAVAHTQAAMTALVRRCGQALGRLPAAAPMNDDERAMLIVDARAADDELPETLLAMTASVMIALGSDDEYKDMQSLRDIILHQHEQNAAKRAERLEALASTIFAITRRRRVRLSGQA